LLQEKSAIIAEEEEKVRKIAETYHQNGGNIELVHPGSWEAWYSAFSQVGLSISLKDMLMHGFMIYFVVVSTELHTHVA
jgi:hypothetical protein